MQRRILIDASSLVALINKRDRFHSWVTKEVTHLTYPFLTCEAVITETCFLLQDLYGGEDAVLGLVSSGNIQIPFQISDEIGTVRELMKRYQNVPMSLADACLVIMSELIAGSCVLTLDSDFRIYRRNKNEMIDVIIADGL